MARYSSIIVAFFLSLSSTTNTSKRRGGGGISSIVSATATNSETGITFFDQDYDEGGEVTYFTYGSTPRKPDDTNNENGVINIPQEAVQTFITEYYNYGSRVDTDTLANEIEESLMTDSTVAVAAKGGKEPPELVENELVDDVNGVDGGESGVVELMEEEEESGSTAELYVGTAQNTTLESNSPTLTPTTYTLHPLHNTPIPNNCIKRIEEGKKLTKACLLWLDKNPQWNYPSVSPTGMPTLGPSVFAEVSKIVTILEEDENGTVGSEEEEESGGGTVVVVNENGTHSIYDFEGTLVESMLDVDNNSNSSTPSNSTTTTEDSDQSVEETNPTQQAVSVTYRLSPTDDTFMEVWRPNIPLGKKDKLKIDATSKEDEKGGKDGEGGVPTKFIQLKFGLAKIFRDVEEMMMEMQTTSMELSSATLQLHAITSTTFGGYILPISSNDWNEETATWEDYVQDWGGGDKNKFKNDATKLLPSEEQPSVAQFGNVKEGTNVTTDLTIQVLKTLCCIEGKTMALRIVTNSSDGVIYASKEHLSGYGPVLELEFLLKTNATEVVDLVPAELNDVLDVVPTSSPSTAPTESPMEFMPAEVRPFKNEGVGEKTPINNGTDEWIIDDGAEEEDNSTTTYVVSSSFRMTITAIETAADERRRTLLRASSSGHMKEKKSDYNTRHLVANAYQTLQEKEEPAIIEHLTRVYAEVLSIAPTNISVVFEEDLVVEDITPVVIRESVFRVMAIFDDPDVSNIQPEDAANVLDQATIYSFIGPEELMFISVYKNTGEPIADEPATYDVTVMKQADEEEDLQGASANAGDTNEGEENGSSSSTSTTPQWLQPTLIAGASVVVFASTAAALLLYRQRHGDSDHGGSRKRGGDSPRSLAETDAPSTPSPNVFTNRFKNKKKFDYAEFGDDDLAEQSSPEVMSPLTATDLNEHAREFSATAGGQTAIGVSRSRMPQQQQVVEGSRINDIKFMESQNISFDDSSVSDVSAHVLGAKGSLKSNKTDASQAESLLLDTTMESYNMEAMSALDFGKFENVLPSSPTAQPTQQRERGLSQATSEDDADGSVPSELYSNLSIDSSLLHSHDTSGATYGNHLFTLDMLRNKDSSLLQMPPPPSDAASDSSYSQQDVGIDDVDNIGEPIVPADSGVSGIENVPMREKNEQDAVSQSINNELSKVMELLKSTESTDDGSHAHIGTVLDGVPGSATKNTASRQYEGPEGLNVLVDDASTDAEPDENDPMKQMNNALTDCMDILEKARVHHHQQPQAPSTNTEKTNKKGGVAAAYLEALSRKNSVDDGEEESSLVTQRLD